MARRQALPDAAGYFGDFGGRYVPETLMAPLAELAHAYDKLSRRRAFRRELAAVLRDFAGRPTPLFHAERLSAELGGARIYLKREDLLHTGAHKINNATGQCLLARSMGKKRVIAETGAGQHGVATASAAALLGLACVVYMGTEDMRRQRLNVDRMRLLGAEVVPVDAGSRTLKDAINEALRDWVTNVHTTHYVLGSVLGPDPYPRMVRDFHRVIGEEARAQLKRQAGTDAPDLAVACVGGGSNAIGLFSAFLTDRRVRLIGVEAGGSGGGPGEHAARFATGSLGVLHGTRTLVLQDSEGQIAPTHSVSAGLDYPAVGPEHVLLQQSGRVEYTFATDAEAVSAFHLLAETEGILPALESAHALAEAIRHAPKLSRRRIILVNLSGRGDKDLDSVLEYDREHGVSAHLGLDAELPYVPGGHGWRAVTAVPAASGRRGAERPPVEAYAVPPPGSGGSGEAEEGGAGDVAGGTQDRFAGAGELAAGEIFGGAGDFAADDLAEEDFAAAGDFAAGEGIAGPDDLDEDLADPDPDDPDGDLDRGAGLAAGGGRGAEKRGAGGGGALPPFARGGGGAAGSGLDPAGRRPGGAR